MKPYRLIGMDHSVSFTQLKRFLQWKNIPFTITTADQAVLRSEVEARMGCMKLPLIVTPSNHTWSNPLDIVDRFEARYPEPCLVPRSASGRFVQALMEMFSTFWLAPLVQAHFAAEAPESFHDRISATLWPNDPASEDLTLTRRLFQQTTSRLARSGFDPSDRSGLETRLEEVLRLIERRLSRGTFLLGETPTRSDLALLAPLSLLWRNSPAMAAKRTECAGIQAWMIQMFELTSGQDATFSGRAHLPESAKPLATFAAREMIPLAFEAASAISDWADAHPGKINLPPVLGSGSEAGGSVGRRELTSELQWQLQRLIAAIGEDGIPASEQEKFEDIGLKNVGDWQLPRDIRYENHRYRVDLLSAQESSPPVQDLDDDLAQVLDDAHESRDLDLLLTS